METGLDDENNQESVVGRPSYPLFFMFTSLGEQTWQ
jgi:hypothetical protein